jgi:hypothetical protein
MGLPYLMLGLLALVIIYGLAWAQARTTVYTLTTARVVMRIGAALPVTFNLPFKQIGAARLDLRRDGTGTIALDTLGETRISYLVCLAACAALAHAPDRTRAALHPRCRQRVARILAEAAEAAAAGSRKSPRGADDPPYGLRNRGPHDQPAPPKHAIQKEMVPEGPWADAGSCLRVALLLITYAV